MTISPAIGRSIPNVSPLCRCLHRDDLHLARQIHEALIPASFSHPQVDVSIQFQPRDWLGGDYCQAVMIEDRVLYLTLCDVTGHGIGSAMLASRVSMVVRGILELKPSPRNILERLDGFYRQFYANTAEELPLSFLACRLVLDDGALTYASAGHPGPLLLRRADRSQVHLPTQNLLIGVLDSCLIDPIEHSVMLGPGDRLALFSDGVTDAKASDSSTLGIAGLARTISSNGHLDVFSLGRQIFEDLDSTSPEQIVDDRTLILLDFC